MKSKLKIAFAGASGTGKTTAATILSKKLGLEINPVGSRTVSAEMGFKSPYDVDAFGKRSEFQKKLLEDKMSWESSHDKFITDRTHLDNLVYSIMHNCVQTVNVDFINSAILYSQAYTHVVFFPLESFINVAEDNCRLNNIDYQKTYEFLLKMFINNNLPKDRLLTINSSSLDSRVQEIMEFIK
jgi:dephospho-CoA kinase